MSGRLLTAEELAAIRGRLASPGSFMPGEDGVAFRLSALVQSGWSQSVASFIAHAPCDLPALLALVAVLEGLLSDMAGDEGRGLVLRYRRALQEIIDRHSFSSVASTIAREAIYIDEKEEPNG